MVAPGQQNRPPRCGTQWWGAGGIGTTDGAGLHGDPVFQAWESTRWARVSRAAKWLVTGVASLVTFAVCLWLAAAVKLPFLPKAEADRWVVNAAFASVTAACVVACGTWWAGRENRPGSADGSTDGAGQQIIESPGSFQLGSGARMKARDINVTVNPAPATPPGGGEVEAPKA